MSDPAPDFDALLAARFEREHTHVPAEPFVTATLRKVRDRQRRAAGLRIGLRVAALVAVVLASPWLTAGAAHFNAALESSLAWTAALPSAWALATLAALVVILAARIRHRG